jgi:4'-phosphopantetheinyl transferase
VAIATRPVPAHEVTGYGREQIEVWRVPLCRRPRPEDVRLLTVTERDRFARSYRERDAAGFAASRAAVRRLAAGRLGVGACEIRLGRDACPGCSNPDHGPPRITSPEGGLRMSLSRSGHWALVALALTASIGVDVEVGPCDDEEALETVLSGAEAAHLRTLPPDRRSAALLRCWTRKEAVTKAAGTGIVADLRQVGVAPHLSGPVVVDHDAGHGWERWLVTDVPMPDGTSAAVCWPAALPASVVVRDTHLRASA